MSLVDPNRTPEYQNSLLINGHSVSQMGNPLIILLLSQSILSRIAAATQFTNTPLPPKLRKGSVSPLVGKIPMFTPLFMIVCTPSHTAMPCASKAANGRSRNAAWRPMAKERINKMANSMKTAHTPTKPSSSAITASKKSVCASGK